MHRRPDDSGNALREHALSRGATIVGALPLLVVVAAGGLLATQQGGYYVNQWMPFGLALVALVASLWAFDVPVHARMGRWGVAALGALAAYAAWSFASIAWAADRSAAWVEADRTLLYAALAIAVARLACLRTVPVRSAVTIMGAVPVALAVAVLLRLPGDAAELFYRGRLLGQVGYYNATATFLLMAYWSALWVALERRLPSVVRGVALAGGTLAASVALLAQSRGSLAAFAVGAVLFAVLAPQRVRALAPFAISVVAIAALGLTRINAVYESLDDAAVSRAAVREAVHAIWWVTLAALVAGVAWAVLDARVGLRPDRPRSRRFSPRARRRATAVVVLAVALAAVAAVVTHDVAGSARDAWDRFRTPTIAERGGGASRLTNISNNGRLDLWSTALDITATAPVRGVGAGNFEAFNYQLRTGHGGYVRQPHNLLLEALSERGIVGAALLLAAFACVFTCAVRAARARTRASDPAGALIVAALAATCVEWLAHAQLEWLWQLPGASWMAFVAMGLLVAAPWEPAHDPIARRVVGVRRVGLRVGAVVVTIVAFGAFAAPYLADRYVTLSRAQLDTSPAAARASVARAERMEPVSVDAAIQRLSIAHATGDRAAGRAAIRALVSRSPEHWSTYMTVSTYYADIGEPELSARWRARSRARNPIGFDFDADRDRESRREPVTSQHGA